MERRRKHASHSTPKNSSPRVTVINRQTILKIDTPSVRKLVTFFLSEMKVSCEEVSVYFVGKRKISELHKQFFQDPSPTDCMSFPLDSEFLGEIFICPQVALEYNPKAPLEEITLYILHSLLHLLGYDDIDKRKRVIMRREEKRLMKLARKHRCILETSS